MAARGIGTRVRVAAVTQGGWGLYTGPGGGAYTGPGGGMYTGPRGGMYTGPGGGLYTGPGGGMYTGREAASIRAPVEACTQVRVAGSIVVPVRDVYRSK